MDLAPPPYVRLINDPPGGDAQTSSHQQQQSVVVVNSGQPVIYQSALVQSFSGHILLSCIVFWCCGIVFGTFAFIFAVMAQSYSTSLNMKDRETARRLGKASIALSVIGVIVGVVLIILVVCLSVAGVSAAVAENCPHFQNGNCFKHMNEESSILCAIRQGYFSNDVCYYN